MSIRDEDSAGQHTETNPYSHKNRGSPSSRHNTLIEWAFRGVKPISGGIQRCPVLVIRVLGF